LSEVLINRLLSLLLLLLLLQFLVGKEAFYFLSKTEKSFLCRAENFLCRLAVFDADECALDLRADFLSTAFEIGLFILLSNLRARSLEECANLVDGVRRIALRSSTTALPILKLTLLLLLRVAPEVF
jgi:hypothetical protein